MKVGDLVRWWDRQGVVVEEFQDPTWGDTLLRIMWFNGKVNTVGLKYLESFNER
jgi:hypothetical protein